MRNTAFLAAVTLFAAACGGSSGTSTTATPSSAPATASTTASAGADACSAGGCQVNVEVPSDVVQQFARQQANYKVYQGCPRNFGVSKAEDLRGKDPIVTSRTDNISIPATLTGRLATVAIFFGATPARYAVVDFGARKSQTVNFGYRWEGNAMVDDKTIVNTITSNIARTCR